MFTFITFDTFCKGLSDAAIARYIRIAANAANSGRTLSEYLPVEVLADDIAAWYADNYDCDNPQYKRSAI